MYNNKCQEKLITSAPVIPDVSHELKYCMEKEHEMKAELDKLQALLDIPSMLESPVTRARARQRYPTRSRPSSADTATLGSIALRCQRWVAKCMDFLEDKCRDAVNNIHLNLSRLEELYQAVCCQANVTSQLPGTVSMSPNNVNCNTNCNNTYNITTLHHHYHYHGSAKRSPPSSSQLTPLCHKGPLSSLNSAQHDTFHCSPPSTAWDDTVITPVGVSSGATSEDWWNHPCVPSVISRPISSESTSSTQSTPRKSPRCLSPIRRSLALGKDETHNGPLPMENIRLKRGSLLKSIRRDVSLF